MTIFIPKGYYALERAVLLLAKERDQSLWDTGKMTAEEIVAYERLGTDGHFVDLPKLLQAIELRLRDRKTGELPDDTISKRLESYKSAQLLVRSALHSGELRSILLFSETGQEIENPRESWAQDNAIKWFDDGICYVPTGGTRKISDGLYVPGFPDDLNFIEEPNSAEARILIDIDSFSDWYYSGAGPMADVDAQERDKGGRPLEYDWDSIKAFALELLRQHGRPGKGNRRLPNKSQFAEAIMDEWAKKGIQLAEPTVRRYVGLWLKEF